MNTERRRYRKMRRLFKNVLVQNNMKPDIEVDDHDNNLLIINPVKLQESVSALQTRREDYVPFEKQKEWTPEKNCSKSDSYRALSESFENHSPKRRHTDTLPAKVLVKKEKVKENSLDEKALLHKQMDKQQRIELFKKNLHMKPAAHNLSEAFDQINSTLVDIENKYAPKADDREFYHSKRYGRMFPLTKDKVYFNPDTGENEVVSVGFLIVLKENGSFEFWSKGPRPEKVFSKKGEKVLSNISLGI